MDIAPGHAVLEDNCCEHDGYTDGDAIAPQEQEMPWNLPQERSSDATETLGHSTPLPQPCGIEPLPGDTESSVFSNIFQEPVNEKVVVSKGDILLMVFKHALKNNLTLTGLSNLIDLINLIFEQPVLPQSRYRITKLLEKSDTSMAFHHFCKKCFTEINQVDPSSPSQCPRCSTVTNVSRISDATFFVLLNVESQLQKLLKKCDLLDLTKPLPHKGTLSDIWDGEMYRNFVFSTREFGHRISFSLNADGTPIFKSSGTAIWPIQLIINELPAEHRMSKLVLAALWFGKQKPDMGLFQNAFVNQMAKLSNDGFSLVREGKLQNYKAFCVCSAVDAVARVPMQGVTQFNGYFGCNWCLQKGEWAGGSMKYPVESVDPEERTEGQMLRDMELPLKEGRPIHGVKTVSALVNLPQFHIVWSFVPDYMHCILLGVGRQFLDMWFASSNSPHSINCELERADQRLMTIQPPNDVTRSSKTFCCFIASLCSMEFSRRYTWNTGHA